MVQQVTPYFFHLFCWVNKNIYMINSNYNDYRNKRNNKFNAFFTLIISDLIQANNTVLHNNFLRAIDHMIIEKTTKDNLMDRMIIYNVLFDYLILSFKYKPSVSKSIYDHIYKKAPRLLTELDYYKGEVNMPLHYYTDIFIKPIYNFKYYEK